MKITYSPTADAMYIYFQNGKRQRGVVKETKELQSGVLLDVGNDDSLFGIEILDVSRRMPLDTIKTITLDLSEMPV